MIGIPTTRRARARLLRCEEQCAWPRRRDERLGDREAVRELGLWHSLWHRRATKAPSFAGDLLRFLVPCGVGLAVATMAVAAAIRFR